MEQDLVDQNRAVCVLLGVLMKMVLWDRLGIKPFDDESWNDEVLFRAGLL